MNTHKFDYRWKLADANFTKDKGKVFSCFACGGGSSMGYKLAGFDVIGCNEIDGIMRKYDGKIELVSSPDDEFRVKYILTFNRTNILKTL